MGTVRASDRVNEVDQSLIHGELALAKRTRKGRRNRMAS